MMIMIKKIMMNYYLQAEGPGVARGKKFNFF